MTTHQAPPVIYPMGRSRFLGSLLLGLWLAGLLAVLLWLDAARSLDWRAVLALAAVLGAGVAVCAGWRNAATGQLAWDGEVWRWESTNYQTGVAEYELLVIADFQHTLLLRFENKARARLWLWVERRVLPERWLDLRRAVYSPRKSSAMSRPHDFMRTEPSPIVAVSGSMHPVDLPQIKP